MKFVEQTVAGIDISQERISIALLKCGKNGPKLVKSVVAPIPAGAIKEGNIADAVFGIGRWGVPPRRTGGRSRVSGRSRQSARR